jgi:hypothetical protein
LATVATAVKAIRMTQVVTTRVIFRPAAVMARPLHKRSADRCGFP